MESGEKTNYCGCPYYRSCHEYRQLGQIELRELEGSTIEMCEFFRCLKPMYDEFLIKNNQN